MALWRLAQTKFEFVPPQEIRGEAIAAADRAVALDPNLAEAPCVRALVAFHGEWDVAKSLQYFERAVALQPGDASVHFMYGQILTRLQRFDEARPQLEDFRKVDPLSPWNDIILIAWWEYHGQFENGMVEGEQARARFPTLWFIPGKWEGSPPPRAAG